MYKVIKDFIDLQDNNYKYHAGDMFPRNGIEISEQRFEELATYKNRRGIPVIEKIAEEIKEEPPVIEEQPVVEEKPVAKKKSSGRKKSDAE